MGESYATKMYLISSSDYTLFQECKRKNQTQPDQAHPDHQSVQENNLPETNTEANTTSNIHHPNSTEETGAGRRKKVTEADVKHFNQDFITKQNIKQFLENQQWAQLYKRILPLIKHGKSLEHSRILDNSELEESGIPNIESTLRHDETEDPLSVWTTPGRYSTPVQTPVKTDFPPDSPVKTKKKKTPKKIPKSKIPKLVLNYTAPNLSTSASTSPFPPAKSTRQNKKKRKDEQSGRGTEDFKKFKGWSSLKLSK